MSQEGDELFMLIQSMTHVERVGYRKHCGKNVRKGTNNYLILFNYLCDLRASGELNWKQLAQGKLIDGNLPSTRTRLLQNILSYLGKRPENDDIESQVQSLIKDAKLLLNRGIYRQCSKLLSKARNLAEKEDLGFYALRISEIQRVLYFHSQSKNLSEEALRITLQETGIMEQARIRLDCDLLALRSHALAKEKLFRGKEDVAVQNLVKEIDELEKAALYESGSRISWLDAAGLAAIMQNQFPQAKEYYSTLMREWQERPSLIRLRIHEFITSIFNYLNTCLFHKEFEVLEKTLQSAQNLPVEDPLQAVRLQLNLHYLHLIFYMNAGRLEEGFDLLPEIRKFLEKHDLRIPESRKRGLLYNMATVSLLLGEYNRTFSYANLILNMPVSEGRVPPALIASSLIQAICFYETHEVLWLQNNLRSLKRKLPSSGLIVKAGRNLITVLNAGIKGGEAELKKAAIAAKEDMENTLDWQKQAPPTGFMEILYWLRARAAGIGIKELYLSGFKK